MYICSEDASFLLEVIFPFFFSDSFWTNFYQRWSSDTVRGRSRLLRKRSDARRRNTFLVGGQGAKCHAPELRNCISCSLIRRRSQLSIGRSPPRAFDDKSTFHLLTLDKALVSCLLQFNLQINFIMIVLLWGMIFHL